MLASKSVVVLDGGSGVSLVKMGHSFIENEPLWSAVAVVLHPQDLKELHKEFFTSGADIVLSATYQASVGGYMKRFDVSETRALEYLQEGVRLVQQARDEAEKQTGRHGYVAASIGPYGATLCDRSEYHGRYVDTMTLKELKDWHHSRLSAILETKPDLLAIETIPALKEAQAILEALESFEGVKAWMTFQCKDGEHLSHGESLLEVATVAASNPKVIAVGVNCVHPKHVTSLVRQIKRANLDIPIIVKPNGGKFEDGHEVEEAEVQRIQAFVQDWVQEGASWVGGCCHIYPPDIADIRDILSKMADVQLNSQQEQRPPF